MRTLGKRVESKGSRGFESPPLRHLSISYLWCTVSETRVQFKSLVMNERLLSFVLLSFDNPRFEVNFGAGHDDNRFSPVGHCCAEITVQEMKQSA